VRVYVSIFAVYPIIFFLTKWYQIPNLSVSMFRWTGTASAVTTASFPIIFLNVAFLRRAEKSVVIEIRLIRVD